jgi:Mrp family chromosome partitioning ATPase
MGQLSVIDSQSLADEVATQVGNGETSASIQSAVSISHTPKTDIVKIKATTDDPNLSATIANQYANTYLAELNEQVDASQQPQLDALQSQLTNLLNQLDTVNAKIAEALKPYLPKTAGDPAAGPIPDAAVVAPDLVTQRDTLLSQYNELLQTKTQMQLNGQLQVTSEVVQQAVASSTATVSSSNLLVLAGMVAGAFIGVVVAAIVAQVRSRVVSEDQLADALGRNVFGRMPLIRNLSGNHRLALEGIEPPVTTFVDKLCARAEAQVRHGQATTILVVGSQRAAGSTTLASALAARFAAAGAQTLLIDANTRRPELSVLYASGAQSGLAGLLIPPGADPAPGTLSRTAVPGVSVVGLGHRGEMSPLRRQTLPQLFDSAASRAQVVIYDGGPLLDAASNAQLARLVDAVVLAVPADRQKLRDLAIIVAALEGVPGQVLPVLVPARRPQRRRSPAVRPSQTTQAEAPAAQVPVKSPLADAPEPQAPTARGVGAGEREVLPTGPSVPQGRTEAGLP